MITVLESINLSAQYLLQKGIESPRTNAELLLGHILGCKRLDLYLLFERPLSENEIKNYREYIKRRGNFEPLQYIVGTIEFYSLELKVNPSVLIPRPETELLIENILNQFPKEQNLVILDIGCGSGNIAIALAVNLPSSKIVSTDVSQEALFVAKENSERHNVAGRIKFVRHDILKNDLNSFPMFDVVVSNPPYVSKENYSTLQKEIKDFEPVIAVSDERDGYTFYREISTKAAAKLKQNGKLFFEVAQGQSDDVKNIMAKNNFINISTIKDYQNINRIVYGALNESSRSKS
jgi:release factor glutamine methyltransferase